MPKERSSESFVDQIKAIMAERSDSYAHPQDNHQLTAHLWGLWTGAAAKSGHKAMTAEDVCIYNILQKLSRLAHGTHDDSLLDIVGYCENISMLAEDQRNRRT